MQCASKSENACQHECANLENPSKCIEKCLKDELKHCSSELMECKEVCNYGQLIKCERKLGDCHKSSAKKCSEKNTTEGFNSS